MRRDPEEFADSELSLVYIARKLRDALRLEEVFTQAGVDYLVESDRYSAGTIFRTERIGAFFYVTAESTAAARDTLRRCGFIPYQE